MTNTERFYKGQTHERSNGAFGIAVGALPDSAVRGPVRRGLAIRKRDVTA